MVDKYDEDLYENPFFIALQSKYQQLNETASSNCWTLCIPRYCTIEHGNFTEQDVKDHIIVTTKTDTESYSTWSGRKVKIEDGDIALKVENEDNKVPILFEETFYNNNDESYKVLCIGWPLNVIPIADSIKNDNLKNAARPSTYEDCCQLLFSHSGGKKSQDAVDKMLDSFAKSYHISGDKFIDIVDIASAQYTKVMQTVLKDSTVRRQAQESQGNMDNLKFAVEAYMMQAIHKELFQVILTNVSSQDTEINKMRRNLKDINLNNLGVRLDFIGNILPARKELLRLNSYSTPFGRMKCLKRVVSVLCRPPKQQNLEDSTVITTDDFLPMLIFLIVKSDIPNWMANLMYMKHFHFARTTDDDEYLYYLTTVEAGLEHIKSGKLTEESNQAATVVFHKPENKPELNRQQSGNVVDKFFHYVQCGDESAVIMLLRKSKSGHEDVSPLMCHPLCSCEKCSHLTSQAKKDENLVTAYSRGDRGYTALHIAALHGQAHLIDLLIKHGALVNASDYLGLTPLHLACQKGFQNIIILLLHFKADVSLTDGMGNSALHLCADNGHEDCVKAIVFSDVCKGKLKINAQNERGDTPLHVAAKWGYSGIVVILLENGADVTIRNRKKQTALNLAQNKNVVQIFMEFQNMPKTELTRSYSQTDLDYGDMKGVKPDSQKKSRTESVSLPNTPIVASLDHMQDRQIELLYKAIEHNDIPLVQYYFGWTNDNEEDAPNSLEMCHPLCQCERCTSIHKISGSGKYGLHVRIKDKKGYTPLHKAVLASSLSLVHMFVSKGADINDVTQKSITPLHLACYLGYTDISNYLIGNGAFVNVKDSMLDTPLHLCCYKGFLEVIDVLIQNHAPLNVVNMQGDTPLHVAVKTQKIDSVRKLLKAGASTSIRNKDGGIPLYYAKKQEIVELLNAYVDDTYGNKENKITSLPGANANASENQSKIHHILKATEESDLNKLHDLCKSIKTFDPYSSLRRTETKDKSSSHLLNLQRQLSIRAFDLSTLKHVQSVDKSEPLHIYKLVLEEKGKLLQENNTLVDEALDIEETCEKNSNENARIQ